MILGRVGFGFGFGFEVRMRNTSTKRDFISFKVNVQTSRNKRMWGPTPPKKETKIVAETGILMRGHNIVVFRTQGFTALLATEPQLFLMLKSQPASRLEI